MEYQDIYDKLYGNKKIEHQTVIACLNAANYILQSETAPTDTESTEYQDYLAKVRWSQSVLANPTAAARKMIPAVMTNTDVQTAEGEVIDDTIQWIIESAILAYSPIM